MSKPLKIFITYAHKNTKAKDELITHLAVMKSEGLISIWHDNEIVPGDRWREEIFSTHLPTSDMLLYLVSAYSLASENCNKELGIALDEKIRIIPIILEHCDWQNHQLSDFQALPDRGLPITKWSDKSEGWQSVVDGVRRSIHKIQSQADLLSSTSEKELRTEVAFQRGNVLMMLGQIERAIKAYSQAIELNPQDADAYNNRGVAYESNSDFNLAIQDFNMAKRLRPDYAIVYYNSGIVYGKKGMLDIAIQNYGTAIKLQPDYAEAYNNRANVYSRQRKFDQAMADYKTAIQLRPDLAEIYYSRAVTRVGKGEIDEAINDYSMAIRLKPDYTEAYLNRGTVYGGKGSVDEAISDYSMAIRLKSDYAEAYYDRGNAYFNKSEYTRAIADYEKVIGLKPNYTDAYLNLGVSYIKQNQIDLAIQNFDMAIRCKPDYPAAYVNRGHAYIDKRKFDNAIKDYSRAIQLQPELATALRPNCAAAYFGRGTAYLRKGEPTLAINDYTTVIELEPDNAAAYGNRGNAYLLKGEIDKAIEDYSRSIKHAPKDAMSYSNRGVAYLRKGEIDKTIEDASKAIELDEKLSNAYYNRAEARLRLKEWDKAKVDLTTAKKLGMDIVATFHNAYRDVAMFERRNGVRLPQDIVAMLRQYPVNSFTTTQRVLTAEGETQESYAVLELLEKFRNAGKPLSEYLHGQPSRGITTGYNEAFIVEAATRDALIAEHPSSADVLKPFVMARDIQRWRVKPVDESRREPQDKWLVFAHRGIDIEAYPAIEKHLGKYRDALEKRSGKQEWYELQTAPKDTTRFTQPKCIYADMASETAFAFDDESYYVGSPASLLSTDELWLLGVLNTRAVSWFYARTAPQVRGPFLKFVPRYVSQIPIPDMEPEQKALIHKIVEYILYLKKQPTVNSRDLKYARDRVMVGYFNRIIDGMVYESYLPDELHKGSKHFFQPLLDEQLPQLEEIQGDKMSAFRDIFEHLHERTHPIRINLFFLDSVKPIRIIESKA